LCGVVILSSIDRWAFYQFASLYGSRSVKLKLDIGALKA